MANLAPALILVALLCSHCGESAGIEGTWVVDKGASRQALDSLGDEIPGELRGIYSDAIEKLEVELTLRGDGSFEIRGDTMGGAVSVKGSYEVDEEKIAVSITEEDGNRKAPPEVVVGSLVNGVIRLRLLKAMPSDLVFRQR